MSLLSLNIYIYFCAVRHTTEKSWKRTHWEIEAATGNLCVNSALPHARNPPRLRRLTEAVSEPAQTGCGNGTVGTGALTASQPLIGEPSAHFRLVKLQQLSTSQYYFMCCLLAAGMTLNGELCDCVLTSLAEPCADLRCVCVCVQKLCVVSMFHRRKSRRVKSKRESN